MWKPWPAWRSAFVKNVLLEHGQTCLCPYFATMVEVNGFYGDLLAHKPGTFKSWLFISKYADFCKLSEKTSNELALHPVSWEWLQKEPLPLFVRAQVGWVEKEVWVWGLNTRELVHLSTLRGHPRLQVGFLIYFEYNWKCWSSLCFWEIMICGMDQWAAIPGLIKPYLLSSFCECNEYLCI